MNDILLNALISAAATGILAAIIYFAIKPRLIKKMLNDPDIVRKVIVSEECEVLMCTKKFPWYCDLNDFLEYATQQRKSNPKLEIVGNYTKYGGYAVSCEWWKFGCDSEKYNMEKMIGKYCRTALPSCALFIPGTPLDVIISMLKDAKK